MWDTEELHLEETMANLPAKSARCCWRLALTWWRLVGFAGNAILTFLILFFLFRDGRVAIENVIARFAR